MITIPQIYCDPKQPQDTYRGYLLELYQAIAKTVPWLSDFKSWYYSCMDWGQMMDDLLR